jgi:glycosyltransferase involved in cell wall biosynthesis
MEGISVVIITNNEAAILDKTLAAAKPVADELIIVDSGSADNTLVIAQKWGAKIITQPWLGFGPQKNVGLKAASFPFILALDADEILTPELTAEINQCRQNGLQGAYIMCFQNFYFGKFLKHGLEYPLKKIRLFDKRMMHWDDRIVHESLVVPDKTPVKELKGFIHHYSYQSIEQYLLKANHYTTAGAHALYAKGKKASWIKIFLSPLFTFIQSYFFKLGLLDGMHGFIVAIFNAHTNFLKYIKLWRLWQKA